MKVFAISDLHMSFGVDKPMDVFGRCWDNYLDNLVRNWQDKISDDDLVLMPGDFSWAMRPEEAVLDFRFIGGLKGKKIILRGNHDYWWNTVSQVRKMLPEGFYAVQNDACKFNDVVVCGTRGWTCPLGGNCEGLSEQDIKIYKRETERLKLSISSAKRLAEEGDRIVCMMHYPPFNVMRDDSEFVRILVTENIKTVVYGHLHGKECRADRHINKFGADFYLVSTDIVNHDPVEIPVK